MCLMPSRHLGGFSNLHGWRRRSGTAWQNRADIGDKIPVTIIFLGMHKWRALPVHPEVLAVAQDELKATHFAILNRSLEDSCMKFLLGLLA